jgi:hypothetical protein
MCAKGLAEGFGNFNIEGGGNDTADVIGFEDGGINLHSDEIVESPTLLSQAHYDD